jgi:hypothetical protein
MSLPSSLRTKMGRSILSRPILGQIQFRKSFLGYNKLCTSCSCLSTMYSNGAGTSTPRGSGHLSDQAIGIIAGCVLVVIILWLAFLFWRRKKTKTRRQKISNNEETLPSYEAVSPVSEDGLLPRSMREQVRLPAPLTSKRRPQEMLIHQASIPIPPPTEYMSTIPDTAESIETASHLDMSDVLTDSTIPPTIVDPNSDTRDTRGT